MITQTIALLIDAYRELNAKRLFWIVLVLSLVLVGVFACLGINEKGITFLWWTIDAPLFNTNTFTRPVFYKAMLFLPVGLKIWLTWAAAILALISTASIFPDFISSGSIELSLSKPIGRLRLFLTKYLTGLLFVALQVAVFCGASFVVIGWRSGSWDWRLFMGVPLVLAFFSYLFAFCVLMGMLTRSAVASILLTAVLWVVIFLVHTGESGILLQLKVTTEQRVSSLEKQVERLPGLIDAFEAKAKPPEPLPADATEEQKAAFESAEKVANAARRKADSTKADLERAKTNLVDSRKDLVNYTKVHRLFWIGKSLLPKTAETVNLLERYLTSSDDLARFRDAATRPEQVDLGESDDVRVDSRKVGEAMEQELRRRSPRWIIGTSLAFEVFVLGIAAWLFCRRDF